MLVIVMGVSGCGKSTLGETLAKELNWKFLDADHFHSTLNISKMKRKIPLTDADRIPWLLAVHDEVFNHLTKGEQIVLACSALKKRYRALLCYGRVTQESITNSSTSNNQPLVVYLKGSEALIHSRMVKRLHFMPADLLKSQFRDLEEPTDDECHITIDVQNSLSTNIQEVKKIISQNLQSSC